MSDAVLVALIMSIPGTIAAVVGVWNTVTNRRNSSDIKRIEINTNSMAERNEAIAEKLGIQKGKAQEKANPSK
jgi:hypothetical protein